MDLTQIAVFVGFVHVLFGLPALFCPDDFKRAALKFRGKVTNIRLLALINFVVAYLMLSQYSAIEKNWETVISVLGYLFLLRGVVMFWWADFVKGKMKKVLKSDAGPAVIGVVATLLGLALGYLGWYVY